MPAQIVKVPKYLKRDNLDLHNVWASMKYRCNTETSRAYPRYGGRGISVCDEWNSFEPFLKWALSSGYEKGLQLDRIDNDGNYSPENCRFVTSTINMRNSSNTKLKQADVDNIRYLRSKGILQKNIAKMYRVANNTISRICSGKRWA